jgi:hypothetical protein
MSGLDSLLADMEGLSVAPVASTPAPAGRGKSTDGGGGGGGGGGAAKRLTTLFRSPSAFAASARFATEGSEPDRVFWVDWKGWSAFLPP